VTEATERSGTVLIVDDEPEQARLYADFLGDDYDVETADGGEAGIAALSPAFDVLLVDRRMPGVSGNEVVAALEERGLDARVAMVTAVDPDFDILGLGIDDYLVKPLTAADLRETVDRLLAIEAYSERVRELSAKRVKRNVLTVEKTPTELQASEEFARLTTEIQRLEAAVEELEEKIEPAAVTQHR
jgi:DNA-binding response OmpR family regulator